MIIYTPRTDENLNTYFDKVFYINLGHEQKRNEFMLRQFSAYGITNFERIDAVSLQALTPPEQFRNFIKRDAKYILGNLSCVASHKKCMLLAKQRNYNRVLILEDDALFLQDPNVLLRHLMHQNYIESLHLIQYQVPKKLKMT